MCRTIPLLCLALLGAGLGHAADGFALTGSPRHICTNGVHLIWTANHTSDTVDEVVSPDGTVVWTYGVSSEPYAICYDDYEAEPLVWVAGASNYVDQIYVETRVVEEEPIDIGTFAKDMCCTPHGIWLAGYEPGRLVRIDRERLVHWWPKPGGPHGICFDGEYIWLSLYHAGVIQKIDPETGDVLQEVPGLPEVLHIRYGDGYIWAPLRHGTPEVPSAALAKINAQTGDIVWIMPVGRGSAWGCLPDADIVWVSKTGTSEVVGLDAATGEILHDVGVGRDPTGIVRVGPWIWVGCSGDDSIWRFYWPKVPEWRLFPILEVPTVSCSVLRYDHNGMPGFCFLVEWDWDLGYAWRDQEGWHSEIVESEDITGLSPDLAFSPENLPTIVWHRGMGGGEIMFGQKLDGVWRIEQINTWGDVGMKAKIGFLPEGTACGCYYRADEGDLGFFWGRRGHWEVENVDTDGDVGDDNSMAIAPDGRVGISYYDATNRALKFALMTAPHEWTIETVDDLDDAGWWTSLAFLPDGRAAIAYTRHATMSLHVAIGLDGEWDIHDLPVAVGPQDGYSLAVDPLGRPCVVALDYGEPQRIRFFRLIDEEWVEAEVASGGEYYRQGEYVGSFSLAFNQAGRGTVLFGDLSEGTMVMAKEEVLSPWPGLFNPGWNWFSLPCEPLEPEAGLIFRFGDVENRLYRWDPVAKNTELYPDDFRDLELGRGYVLFAAEPLQPVLYGWPTEGVFEIYVPRAGWTWIGHPFSRSVLLEDLKVRNEDTGEVRTMWEDYYSHDGWVNWNLIYWDSAERTARICAPIGGDDDHLRPWYGCRIWTNIDELTLIVPE